MIKDDLAVLGVVRVVIDLCLRSGGMVRFCDSYDVTYYFGDCPSKPWSIREFKPRTAAYVLLKRFEDSLRTDAK